MGNFLAIVAFRRELDPCLDEHLRSGPRNATAVSKTVQNNLLYHMGQFVVKEIIKEVDASPFVAVLADEVRDINNWEQLGIAVYIKDDVAHEKLLSFVQVEQTDGKSICQALVDELSQLGIDISRCRAQAYDSGGNMAGRLRGCQAIFQERYPLASGRYDGKSMTDANGLLNAIQSGKFLVAFYTCRYVSSFLVSLSRLLQGSSQDIVVAYEEVKLVTDQLCDVRSNAEDQFKTLFNTRVERHGHGSFDIPRRCGRQNMRSNLPGTNPEEYWRRSVFIPYVDHMVAELQSRFTILNGKAIQGFNLLPKNCEAIASVVLSADLISGFKDDLPTPRHLEVEIDRWQRKWRVVKEEGGVLPSKVPDTLAQCNRMAYPSIHTILQILLIIPVTTASVERANSSLKFVNTALRSTMTNLRLNALLRLLIHREVDLNFDEIIDSYARSYPRRMKLGRPLEIEEAVDV
ncbi:hypothetical protein BSKO_12484 [Bryopsis sp. KO-2023]|nr:hypothetical protein BSKO_12484 [Bryopsis sp. KO-2023]